MSEQYRAVSLFSGCGGFEWGAKQAGANIIWSNDIDPHAEGAYKSLFPDVEFHPGDVSKIKTFPKADILIGCYPCTGFSVASRRRWRSRENRDLKTNKSNFLYLEFVRALKQVKPKFLFVENVRGMRSADGGWFLNEQLNAFQNEGYVIPEPELLDVSQFGVAQTRKRIFIVGVRNDLGLEYKYPHPSHGPKLRHQFKSLKDTIGDMELWPEGEYLDYKFHGHYLTRNRKRTWDDRSYTIVADAHHVPLHPMGKPMRFVEKDTWELQGEANRRLSWRECARIQDLPHHIEFEETSRLTDKYRVIGNAVPPGMGKALVGEALRLLE